MPRVTSTMRSLSHSASGSRQGRSRKSGFPGRTSIWKRGASLTLRCASRPGSPVVGDDLDASRAGCACRATSSAGATRRHRSRRPTPSPGRLDMTPPPPSHDAYRLPDDLEPLARLARNLAWTWDEEIAAVLAEVDPDGLARASGNPVAMLAAAAPARLDAARGRRRLPCPPGAARRRGSTSTSAAERWYADAARRAGARSPTSRPSSGSARRCRSTRAGSASWPATTSRPPATSACRSSASGCSTATATSASC